VSISSISQSTLYADGTSSTQAPSSTGASATSAASALVKPIASIGTVPSGSAALFKQLTSSLQSLLLQLQGGQVFGATTAPSTGTTSQTQDATTQASFDPTAGPSSADALKGAGQAEPHHHHHHAEEQETGSPGQLQQDAAKLLNDLGNTTGTGASGAASASTATADAGNGISASYFGAYRAYSNAGATPTVPTQLGLA